MILPSILSADFVNLAWDCEDVLAAGGAYHALGRPVLAARVGEVV